ncbi:MAG: phytoene/squalene synthase family protein [Alphaproteobacteria bacterium]
MDLGDAFAYCFRIVKQGDKERYLLCLLPPLEYRPALIALHAFNDTISRIPETVSEPLLGQIRMQWWWDAINSLYKGGRPVAQPIVEALSYTVKRYALDRESFERMLVAREKDVAQWQAETLQDLETYAEATSGELLALSFAVLGEKNQDALQVGRTIGTAYALIGLVRSIGFHARQGRFLMPRDLVEVERVNVREILSLIPSPGLSNIVNQVANRAASLIAVARTQYAKVSYPARTLLLEARIAEHHFKRLRALRFNPFDPHMAQNTDGLIVWRLVLRHFLRLY